MEYISIRRLGTDKKEIAKIEEQWEERNKNIIINRKERNKRKIDYMNMYRLGTDGKDNTKIEEQCKEGKGIRIKWEYDYEQEGQE